MKMGPNLAYIVVQRPYRPDEHQKLSKAAGVPGNTLVPGIDVAMFLDPESAEEFRQNDIVFSHYADVVEVVVTDRASFAKMEAGLATAEERVRALTTELWLAKDPAWIPADLPPGPLPNNYGRSRDVLVVTDVGRVLVAHAYWSRPDGPPAWCSDDFDMIDGVVNWTSLPKLPDKKGT